MKLIRTLARSAVLLLAVAATPVFACTYMIAELAQKNDLMAASASHLKLSLSDVTAINIEGYRWFESISTPMCPKEITHLGVVTLSYSDAETHEHCAATLSVTKRDNWENGSETLDFVGQPVCGG